MPSHPEWYRTLFTGLFVEAQRRFPTQTPAEAEFILKLLEPKPGAKILDVPCGNGRLSIALAEKGFNVTGVDSGEEILGDARKAIAGRNLSATFEQRDMRDLPWSGDFDGAFCWGNSFAYLGDDGDRDFLKAVWRSLKPGGRFGLETGLVAESVFLTRLQKQWFELGDLLFLIDTAYDPTAGTLTSSYTVIHNGRIEKNQAIYRAYTYREMVRMWRDAGFTEIGTFGSFEQAPYALGSPRLFLVGAKPE